MIRNVPRRRPHLAATGRSAIVSAAAAFVVLQLGLALAIEGGLPGLRHPTYTHKARVLGRQVAGTPPPPVVVMLGSSRVAEGLCGRVVADVLAGPCGRRPVVFNFGMGGAGPVVALVALRRLRRDGIRPDVVLVEVLPKELADRGAGPDALGIPAERLALNELAWVAPYAADPAGLRARWAEAAAVPWHTHRLNLLAAVAPWFLPGRYPGPDWGALNDAGELPLSAERPTPEQYRRGFAHARHEYADRLANFRLGGSGPRALADLLAQCRHEGIAARLVLMPEAADFRALYPPAAWAQIEAFLDRLGRQYDAPLINARGWIADAEFRDGHHLLPSGAAIFSARLGREHLRPLLAGSEF